MFVGRLTSNNKHSENVVALSNNQFLFLTLSLVFLDISVDLNWASLSSAGLAFASTLRVRTSSLGCGLSRGGTALLCVVSLSSRQLAWVYSHATARPQEQAGLIVWQSKPYASLCLHLIIQSPESEWKGVINCRPKGLGSRSLLL